MLQGIKIELYLKKEQIVYLNKLFGCSRVVYNKCLEHKQKTYEEQGINLDKKAISKYYHHDLQEEFVWLKEQNTHPLKQTIDDMFTSYTNFFKHGAGYPKFRAKSNDQHIRFPKTNIPVKPFNEDKRELNLVTGLRKMKFSCSERDEKYLYKNKDKIRSITITKRKSGSFYAAVSIDGDLQRTPPKPINDIIGGDVGVKTFLTLSNSFTYENMHFFKKIEKKIKKLHRQLSKKVKGSANYQKARIRLAKAYEKMTNCKLNYLHNITTKLVDENQIICMEDLCVAGMLKNHKLAKAIQEVGIGEFMRQLRYKCT